VIAVLCVMSDYECLFDVFMNSIINIVLFSKSVHQRHAVGRGGSVGSQARAAFAPPQSSTAIGP
jgi:hypothetical protein